MQEIIQDVSYEAVCFLSASQIYSVIALKSHNQILMEGQENFFFKLLFYVHNECFNTAFAQDP